MKYPSYPTYKPSNIDWIWEIPKDWDVRKLKHLLILHSWNGFPHSEQWKKDWIPFLKVSDINWKNKYVDSGNNYVTKKTINQYKWNIIPIWTIIAPKIWEALRKNHRKETKIKCIIDNNCVGIEPIKINHWYNYYLHCFIDFNRFNNDWTIPSLSTEKYSNFHSPFPPLQTQQKISNYLDTQTTQIDTLISKDEKLIELLKQKRISLINEVVTKGLDKNVEMKDSGVEWIGKIPKDWEVRKLKFEKKLRWWYSFKSEVFSDDGNWVVRIGDIKNPFDFEWCVKIPFYEKVPSFFKLKENDCVIALTGATIGKVWIIPKCDKKLYINQRVWWVCDNNSNYYFYLLSSDFIQKQIKLVCGGSAQENISNSQIEDMFIPQIPIQTQQKISNYLDKKTSKINITISKIEKRIELYKERKQSLIHHVVTWKIMV